MNLEKINRIYNLIYEEKKEDELIYIKSLKNFYINLMKENDFIIKSPVLVGLKVTGKCNLKCPNCWASINGDNFSLEKIKITIDELSSMDIFHINISGGEPFIRKDIISILQHVKQKNMAMAVYTNGLLINQNLLCELSEFWNFKTDYFHISFDGADVDSTKRTRGHSQHNKLIDNIKLIVKKGFKIRLHCTVSAENISEIANIYDLAEKLGVYTLSYTPVQLFGSAVALNKKFDALEYFYKIIEIRNKQKLSNSNLNIRVFMPPEIFLFGCMKMGYFTENDIDDNHENPDLQLRNIDLVDTCSIDSALNVTLVPNLNRDNILGTLTLDSFDSIWKKSQVKRIQMLNRNLKMTQCQSCVFFKYCKGGEWTQVYDVHGHCNVESIMCFKKYKKIRGDYDVSYK